MTPNKSSTTCGAAVSPDMVGGGDGSDWDLSGFLEGRRKSEMKFTVLCCWDLCVDSLGVPIGTEQWAKKGIVRIFLRPKKVTAKVREAGCNGPI